MIPIIAWRPHHQHHRQHHRGHSVERGVIPRHMECTFRDALAGKHDDLLAVMRQPLTAQERARIEEVVRPLKTRGSFAEHQIKGFWDEEELRVRRERLNSRDVRSQDAAYYIVHTMGKVAIPLEGASGS